MVRHLACAVLLAAAPVFAQTIAITHGKVADGRGGEPVDGVTVLVRDGRIAAVGRSVAVPPGARVVDATDKWVTPGLFAGFSRLGLVEVDAVDQVNDTGATKGNFGAAIDVAPGLNPAGEPVAVTRADGVTRAATAPDGSRDLFEGQGAIVDLAGGPAMVTRARAFQYVELGETGARSSGGSRGAAFQVLRNGLDEALAFQRNPAGYGEGRSRQSILTRRDAAALVAVVTGAQLLVVRAERASDIREVLGLRRDYPRLRLVLLGANEGWLVAREIAAARVPVVTLGMDDLPARFEQTAATRNNVGRLVAAGVTVALGVPDNDASFQPRLLPQYAGNMVAQGRVPGGVGLSWGQALASITRMPAEVYGLARELGTLEPGKRADVVVWSGDPLELSSAPTMVLIDGRETAMTTRQTRLRDRYLRPNAQGLTYGYNR